MPRVSIDIPDYTYWRLLGAGESTSAIIQQALNEYWKEIDKREKEKPNTVMRLNQI